MESRSLQRKAFLLFFSAIALFLVTVLGVVALCGISVPVVPVGLIATLLSLFSAWLLCLHPESLDEKIRVRNAAELADEARTFFLCSNPIGWLVWLWLGASLLFRMMEPSDDERGNDEKHG